MSEINWSEYRQKIKLYTNEMLKEFSVSHRETERDYRELAKGFLEKYQRYTKLEIQRQKQAEILEEELYKREQDDTTF